MTPRQALLDTLLASYQPVHRLVQLILIDGAQLQSLAEGGDGALRGDGARGGQFGAGVDDAGDDHGDDQIAQAAAGTSDEGVQAELLEGAEDGGDMAVGVAADDGEGVVGGAQSDAALEEDLQAVDDVIGALGEIGEGAFFDFAVMPEGLPKEDGGRGVAVGDAFDIHGDVIGRDCGL